MPADKPLSAAEWVARSRRRKPDSEPPSACDTSEPAAKYTADDLAGMRVAHDLGSIDEGSEQVLTLQDQTIDELEGDQEDLQLESSLMADRERARKGAERRKRKHPLYGADTAYEALKEEEEEEANKRLFTIAKGGRLDSSAADETEAERPGKQTLDYETRAISDFYTEEEAAAVVFKKSKKRAKKKIKGKTSTTNDFGAVDSERVNAILARQTKIDDSNFEDDDDDLQRAIASVRRARNKVAKLEPLDEVEEPVQPVKAHEPENPDESELALSGTIEFVQGLKASVESHGQNEEEEEEAQVVKAAKPRREPARVSSAVPATNPKVSAESAGAAIPATVVEQEPSVGTGLAGALNLLKQRNMLEMPSAEQREREQQQRGREKWMAEHRQQEQRLRLEKQRIKQLGKQPTAKPSGKSDRQRGKPDLMTQRELEELKQKEQETLDRKWAREYEERMRDYKPEVKLEYVDESGRQLTTKEAYKQLSHAFHGHYSGKNKIDKQMKKQERERRQQELASSSTTHQRSAAMETAHRKAGSAAIVFDLEKSPDR
ncbi:hypothetical protein IWW55_000952 [Coemansia sp. RSA 2706]|nr:hypothetical protein IWW55_000952 [Coemansia sp. RSA 2706]KAJ2739240.1 hypothetical protein H4R23_000606 [Coemansia sp. Cherry 401B]